MTQRARRIIFSVAILFFILATPLILLYAWGYSFDWQTRRVALTGGLYLKSQPDDAKIYLNNKPKGETNTLVRRLAPKEYQVKIVKDGFHPWTKRLKVESKIVTDARNILLIPLEPKAEIINEVLPNDFSLQDFITPDKPNSVFYIQTPSYILYKTDQDNSFQEQISLNPLPSDRQYEILVSNNERVAVLDDQGQLYLLNQDSRDFDPISQEVKGMEFTNDNDKLLYFTNSEIWIYFLENTNKELITRFSQEIKQSVWYQKTNQHILCLVGGSIKMIELDGRDERNSVDVLRLNIDQIAYNPENEGIYFIRENKLSSILLK